MKNIPYKTGEIAKYFAHNRIAWQQFYPSEREVIGKLGAGSDHRVLDIGCGCGGLGLALREQFGVRDYTGVEINEQAAAAASTMNPAARIHCGDILELTATALKGQRFDIVFSLSCVDWNVCFADMLAAAWSHVAPGGHLVATFRLTAGAGCSDLSRSYQYINYAGKKEGEIAAYVVLNAQELLNQLAVCSPAEISAFGYWGAPSSTAVTPFERLCFAAMSVRRRLAGDHAPVRCTFDLPEEILAVLSSPQEQLPQ
jgi:precorrin-6B methylase 2